MVDPAPARRWPYSKQIRRLLLAGETLTHSRVIFFVALVWAAGLVGFIVLYGTFGGEASSLEADRPAALPSQAGSVGSESVASNARQDPQFTDEVRSIAAWDAFRAQQSAGFLAELAGPRPTLLAADEPGFEQETATQRRDRDIRTKAAQAARQKAEQGAGQSPSEAPVTGTAVEPPEARQVGALSEPSETPNRSAPPLTGENLSRSLQTQLKRVGCDPGKVDGQWNSESRRALESFNRRAGTKLDVKVASREALAAVKAQKARVCPVSCQPGHPARNERCIETENENSTLSSHPVVPPGSSVFGTTHLPRAKTQSAAPLAGGSSGRNCFTMQDHLFCN
jgi:hypothetical protein